MNKPTAENVYQFKIMLLGKKPVIWRQIQVPGNYNMWDLHIAIQDAMGWFDYHLHEFQFGMAGAGSGQVSSIVDESMHPYNDVLHGWEVLVSQFFRKVGDSTFYDHDFGDIWRHKIILEGILPKESRVRYPKCIDGQGNCPPEDMPEIGKTPGHEELNFTGTELEHHVNNLLYQKFEHFDVSKVKFENPRKCWKFAYLERK